MCIDDPYTMKSSKFEEFALPPLTCEILGKKIEFQIAGSQERNSIGGQNIDKCLKLHRMSYFMSSRKSKILPYDTHCPSVKPIAINYGLCGPPNV